MALAVARLCRVDHAHLACRILQNLKPLYISAIHSRMPLHGIPDETLPSSEQLGQLIMDARFAI